MDWPKKSRPVSVIQSVRRVFLPLAVRRSSSRSLAYFVPGLIASLIHIVRLGGAGYFEFETAAKPRVEMVEVLVSWFTTGLLLAFFAFLLKIGDAFSRGSFLVFWALAPIGLLGSRRIAKSVIGRAAAQGAIGRYPARLSQRDRCLAAPRSIGVLWRQRIQPIYAEYRG